jgi:hypothetical protein
MSASRWMLSAVLMAALPGGAEAAKYCGEPVEGGTSSGTTQEEALLAAQKWWSSRASALGREYGSWDNADDRSLECSKDLKGDYQCKASARPCLPDGAMPLHPENDM